MKNITRRDFLKTLGVATAATTGLAACRKEDGGKAASTGSNQPIPKDKMTYRSCPTSGDKVSILGYGMMRLPTKSVTKDNGEQEDVIDQDAVNELVDYAIEHGVNYFDTSPAYCRGFSERSTGIALKRHPREKYLVATKLSNFDPSTRSRQASIDMYRNSFKELQVETIDYMLLHAVGTGSDSMVEFNDRYMDNGILDFLVEERKAGRIRNLGFSFHGDVKLYDYLLSQHDKYRWDFVQIQLNYLDWEHGEKAGSTDAKYLYEELRKRNIPAIIMEPLLGGRLAKVPDFLVAKLKQREPERSVASWAFRFAGSPEGVLTVLSGMTLMEHLKDNLRSYTPLQPLSDDELAFLKEVADDLFGLKTIPCNDCKYCMPCPYGIDIPAILTHYNKCVNEGNIPRDQQDADYRKQRRAFLVSYDRAVPKLRQASHCIGCNQCTSHCPQGIKIPRELHKIDKYIEELKQNITE